VWIKSHRPVGKGFDIKLEQFEIEWWKWWYEIQPEWRKEAKLLKNGTGFGELYLSGPNGLFQVIVTLGWWGKVSRTMEWDRAVDDVLWVTECFFKSVSCLKDKRKRNTREKEALSASVRQSKRIRNS